MIRLFLAFALFFLCMKSSEGQTASKPLFRDPVFDGAADPVVIYNRMEKKWYMFYTNRRANASGLDGVKWVHGTRIGVAESADGAIWTYKDTCDIQYRTSGYTFWAPEILELKGMYHMYLTYVPGEFSDWNHPRDIIHLTSKDLMHWKYESKLILSSERCIDACVFKLPGKGWRMYYNNEADGKSIYYADSPDLYKWTDSGKKVVGDKAGEGPNVFKWKGKYRMLVDNWQGLGVYSSDDLTTWTRQPENILQTPGTGTDDQVIGGHPDVVISGGHAYVFYFTHPGRIQGNRSKGPIEQRRSSIQVAELEYNDGVITCDRNKALKMTLKGK